MSGTIRFLSLQDILEIHANTTQREGGESGVRDIRLLESAVAMPRQAIGGEYLHPDIADMAVAYLFHLVKNHGFVDGNKRVGLAAAVMFLLENAAPALPSEEDLEEMTLQVAAGSVGKGALIDWMRERCS